MDLWLKLVRLDTEQGISRDMFRCAFFPISFPLFFFCCILCVSLGYPSYPCHFLFVHTFFTSMGSPRKQPFYPFNQMSGVRTAYITPLPDPIFRARYIGLVWFSRMAPQCSWVGHLDSHLSYIPWKYAISYGGQKDQGVKGQDGQFFYKDVIAIVNRGRVNFGIGSILLQRVKRGKQLLELV